MNWVQPVSENIFHLMFQFSKEKNLHENIFHCTWCLGKEINFSIITFHFSRTQKVTFEDKKKGPPKFKVSLFCRFKCSDEHIKLTFEGLVGFSMIDETTLLTYRPLLQVKQHERS